MLLTLMRAYWGERFRRLVVVLLLVVLSAVSLVVVAVSAEPTLGQAGFGYGAILAAGAIGRDVSSGVIAVLFSRPIKRSTYVLARWLAPSLAATALTWLVVLIEAALLWQRGHGVPGVEILTTLIEGAASAFGACAVLVLLSSMVPGIADVALLIAINLLLVAANQVGLPQRATQELESFIHPQLEWSAVFGGTPVSWFGLASYASTVVLCLVLAIVNVNRKEVSYAHAAAG